MHREDGEQSNRFAHENCSASPRHARSPLPATKKKPRPALPSGNGGAILQRGDRISTRYFVSIQLFSNCYPRFDLWHVRCTLSVGSRMKRSNELTDTPAHLRKTQQLLAGVGRMGEVAPCRVVRPGKPRPMYVDPISGIRASFLLRDLLSRGARYAWRGAGEGRGPRDSTTNKIVRTITMVGSPGRRSWSSVSGCISAPMSTTLRHVLRTEKNGC
jgi:hypothetical protein